MWKDKLQEIVREKNLYGIDQQLIGIQPNQSSNGLIEHNKIWYENEWQKNIFF